MRARHLVSQHVSCLGATHQEQLCSASVIEEIKNSLTSIEHEIR